MISVGLYYRTVRHLKPSQFSARLIRFVKLAFEYVIPAPKILGRNSLPINFEPIELTQVYDFGSSVRSNAYLGNRTFCFLNKKAEIDSNWEVSDASLLWRFHLHYFDYLLEDLDAEVVEQILADWLSSVPARDRTAWHPYVISRRVPNWIYAYGKCPLSPKHKQQFFRSLYEQTFYLSRHVEYHLSGNHLLANARGLILGGVFLRDFTFVRKGLEILEQELPEQILPDGAHYERSPMYHCVVLKDLCEIENALSKSPIGVPDFLVEKIVLMAEFLSAILIDNQIPLLNDSSYDLCPSPQKLIRYVSSKFECNIGAALTDNLGRLLTDAGIYVFKSSKTSLVVDVGPIGPDFQPGHAHNDTLSFCLNFDGTNIVTDSGIYEYREGEWRDYFRSVRAHNSVMLNGVEPNETWKSFRVGYRGYPEVVENLDSGKIIARDLSYRRLGFSVTRAVEVLEDSEVVVVFDTISGGRTLSSIESNIHFAPGFEVDSRVDNDGLSTVVLRSGDYAVSLLLLAPGYTVVQRQSWYSGEFGIKSKRANIALLKTNMSNVQSMNKYESYAYALVRGAGGADCIEAIECLKSRVRS